MVFGNVWLIFLFQNVFLSLLIRMVWVHTKPVSLTRWSFFTWIFWLLKEFSFLYNFVIHFGHFYQPKQVLERFLKVFGKVDKFLWPGYPFKISFLSLNFLSPHHVFEAFKTFLWTKKVLEWFLNMFGLSFWCHKVI